MYILKIYSFNVFFYTHTRACIDIFLLYILDIFLLSHCLTSTFALLYIRIKYLVWPGKKILKEYVFNMYITKILSKKLISRYVYISINSQSTSNIYRKDRKFGIHEVVTKDLVYMQTELHKMKAQLATR